MKIRKADPSDIPEIVRVLKASLGDELPVSEEIWDFKHVTNPFGPSIVLLAEEGGKIIGVRAFMRWEWRRGGDRKYSAFRAVDTATLPEFRGKGIFKKLTLAAVEEGRIDGDDFIFNTPNDKSRPGYLKMGWSTAGRIKVSLKLPYPSFSFLKASGKTTEINYQTIPEKIEKLCQTWNKRMSGKTELFTPKSYEYLHWRYERNPLQNYAVYADDRFYLAANVKARKNLRELRITECLTDGQSTSKALVKKIIKSWSRQFGIQVISFSPKTEVPGKIRFTGSFGPQLTVRNLNLALEDYNSFLKMENWNYTLGDLELF